MTEPDTPDHPSASAPPPPGGTPLWRFWQPRYWLLWIGVVALRLLVLLPFRVQLVLGSGLGTLIRWALPGRRHVAAVNLALCFPEQSPAWHRETLRKHFASLGIAVFELGMATWASDARIRKLVHIQGIDNFLPAGKGHQPTILLSAHFPATELTGSLLHQSLPDIAAIYRPNRNPFVDELLRRARTRAGNWLIPKDNMRPMIRALKQGVPVWYAPDQNYRRKFSALIPFFGVPAMTNTALTQLVRMSGARVVPYLPRRRADGKGYDVVILPALTDFPGPTPEDDAARVNAIFEAHIRGAPDQYYWVHRRFKGRPGIPDPY